MYTTPIDLLRKISTEPNARIWDQFYRFYAPVIRLFALRRGVSRECADDVCQEVMIKLARALPNFTRDPAKGKFRDWLKTITVNTLIDRHRCAPATPPVFIGANGYDTLIENLVDENTLPPGTDEENDWLYSHYATALERVKNSKRTPLRTWRIFERHILNGEPADHIAQDEKIPVNTVYQTKKRITERIRIEFLKLQAVSEAVTEEANRA